MIHKPLLVRIEVFSFGTFFFSNDGKQKKEIAEQYLKIRVEKQYVNIYIYIYIYRKNMLIYKETDK